MTNRRKFFINGLMLTAVALSVRGVSLWFNSYVAHKIGAEGIGLFTLIGTLYAFAVTFATSGISLTVTRLIASAVGAGKQKEAVGILHSSIIYSLIFSTFAASVLFFGAEYFGSSVLNDPRAIPSLRILSASLIPLSLSSVFTGYFIGVKRVGYNAVVQILGQVLKIAITLVLIDRLAGSGVASGTLALALSMTLTEIGVFVVAFLQFIIDKRRALGGRGERGMLHEVSAMALPLAVSAYIRSALLTLEHILIPKRLRDRGDTHSDALAAYGVLHGMALPMLLYPMSPLSSFSGLLVPEFSESMARGEGERCKRIASEALNTTLVYAISAMSLLYMFSEEIGYAVYSSYDAGRYIAMMAPVLPIMYLDHVTDSILKGIGEHVYSMWVNISDSLLSVLLVWILIPKMGIAGYAVVIVVMEGYNFALSALRLRHRIKFKINPASSLLAPLLSALAASLISKSIFAKMGSTPHPAWLILEIVFAVAMFLAIYLSLKLLFDEIKKYKKENESGTPT
ncbi:MAG: polysaccharide biosynthesis C-terminal domain-containing protein [Clostridia bacterium]|nr:polysaccharide biosynthesis C-terminal domain-containing protein [Clostridia bacterium]